MKFYSEYENKKVCYEESFWTGKKNIKIEDTEVKLLSKKKLLLNDKEYNIKGNSIIGVELISSDEKITILEKPRWYEWILCFLPIYLAILGGAIGGFVGGGAAVISMYFIRSSKIAIVKVMISFLVLALATALYFILAFSLLGALTIWA